ncbi:hypothetical protein OF820_02495 [Oceanotoga sp. DSM 15011]|uniref:hypothetical protein n=1 Tax=Oceanotoga sp. DSM 15011 TaxID=2984951 RepID=UPI0021F4B1CF|nr:hypothetical protein [Oceanotoga sp. DSM 15011]UYP00561.1 hypothetical protein OF820_02495 [Oceanotoga sp. DSM 15011]
MDFYVERYYNSSQNKENFFWKNAWSFEALIVNYADEIAQRHHDIDDALRLNILDLNDLETSFRNSQEHINHKNNLMNEISHDIVNKLVKDLIENSKLNLEKFIKNFDLNSEEDFYKFHSKTEYSNHDLKKYISYSKKGVDLVEELKNLCKDSILNSYLPQVMDGRGDYIIRKLFKAYITNIQQLPDSTLYSFLCNLKDYKKEKYNSEILEKSKDYILDNKNSKENKMNSNMGKIRTKIKNQELSDYEYSVLLRTIADYISGMTDNYAEEEYKKLYGIIKL